MSLTQKTNELFAPYGCVVTCEDTMHGNKSVYIPDGTVLWDWTPTGHGGDTILLSCKTNEIGIIDNTKPFGSIENGTGINPGEWTFDVNEEPIQPEMYNSGILTNPELGNFSEASNGLNDPTNGFIGIKLKFTRQDVVLQPLELIIFQDGYLRQEHHLLAITLLMEKLLYQA